jgi:hypothetical protein
MRLVHEAERRLPISAVGVDLAHDAQPTVSPYALRLETPELGARSAVLPSRLPVIVFADGIRPK